MPSGSKRRKKTAAKKKEEEEKTLHESGGEEKQVVCAEESQYPSESDVKKVYFEFVTDRPNKDLVERVNEESKHDIRYCSLGLESPVIDKVKNLNFDFVNAKSSEVLLEKLSAEASIASLSHNDAAAREEVAYFSLGGESPASDKCSNIVLQKSNEEVTEASEVLDDSSPFEFEEGRVLTNMGTVIESSAFIGVNDAPATNPRLEHLASIWNCCGLMDLLKGSQRR